MNCAKVLLSYFRKCDIHAKRINFAKNLDIVNNIFLEENKISLHSAAVDMEDIYDPPKHIRGMKVLDRNAFKKTVVISCLNVDSTVLNDVVNISKKHMLKIKGIKSVQQVDGSKQRILMDSKQITCWNDLPEKSRESLKSFNVTEDNFCKIPLELKYENWLHYDLLRAILPENELPITSYSIIGHIVHLNIKEHLHDYKHIIAEILLDKVCTAKTVVYKKNKIDSVYRNFEMEVLCGEPNFIAKVKENHCTFELDFSKVYWNPRLSTEHMRIVDIIKQGDVLFDVFAGVGPFAIPAAKKKCMVYANDLNPESVKWLNHNITLNKKSTDYIKVFNKDGADFLLNDVKENLIKIYENNGNDFSGKIHFTMNLPALSLTFIKYLKGLIRECDFEKVDVEQIRTNLPIIHSYFFTVEGEDLKSHFEENSEMCLNDIEHNFYFVRKVSNSKSMHRITFTLPFKYLMAENLCNENGEPLSKRICTN